MDLFEERAASPMLIARQDEAFDHPDWIYELKMDGFRCLAYIDEACVDFGTSGISGWLPDSRNCRIFTGMFRESASWTEKLLY